MADGGGGAVTRAHRSQALHALCYVGKLDRHFLTSITSMIYMDDARHRVPMRVYVYVRGVIEQPVSPTTSGQFKPITAGPLRTGGRAAAANCSRASTSSLRTSEAGKPPHTHIPTCTLPAQADPSLHQPAAPAARAAAAAMVAPAPSACCLCVRGQGRWYL